MCNIDKKFMKIALELANRGKGFVSPNPMVGAVVVKDGVIVGRGWHKAYGKSHAEVNAINDAGSNAKDAVIYVTLEPCNHFGKTPPCTKKIVDAGISKVVMAMDDPNPTVCGGGKKFLQERGIQVVSGICKAQAVKLNEFFIKYTTAKRPFVAVKCASTLDGRIATKTGNSKWITGANSRKYVHQLRHEYDAILVGIDTVKQDDPSLTVRLEVEEQSSHNCSNGQFAIKNRPFINPIRIILDTKLSISENAKVFNPDLNATNTNLNAANTNSKTATTNPNTTTTNPNVTNTIIVTGSNISLNKKLILEKKGAIVIETQLKNNQIDFNTLLDILGEKKITSLLIEGGSRIIASAFSANIVDKVFFFYAPKILGGDDGIPICRGNGPKLINDSIDIVNVNVKRFDNDILIEGYTKCLPE